MAHSGIILLSELEGFINSSEISVPQYLKEIGIELASVSSARPDGVAECHRISHPKGAWEDPLFMHPDDLEFLRAIIARGPKYLSSNSSHARAIATRAREDVPYYKEGCETAEELFESLREIEAGFPDFVRDECHGRKYFRPLTDNWGWVKRVYVHALECAL